MTAIENEWDVVFDKVHRESQERAQGLVAAAVADLRLVPHLLSALRENQNPDVRSNALDYLRRLGTNVPIEASREPIMGALQHDPVENIREQAALTMVSMGLAQDDAVLEALMAAVNEAGETSRVRRAIVFSLSAAPAGHQALSLLARLAIQDSDPAVKEEARDSLEERGFQPETLLATELQPVSPLITRLAGLLQCSYDLARDWHEGQQKALRSLLTMPTGMHGTENVMYAAEDRSPQSESSLFEVWQDESVAPGINLKLIKYGLDYRARVEVDERWKQEYDGKIVRLTILSRSFISEGVIPEPILIPVGRNTLLGQLEITDQTIIIVQLVRENTT